MGHFIRAFHFHYWDPGAQPDLEYIFLDGNEAFWHYDFKANKKLRRIF